MYRWAPGLCAWPTREARRLINCRTVLPTVTTLPPSPAFQAFYNNLSYANLLAYCCGIIFFSPKAKLGNHLRLRWVECKVRSSGRAPSLPASWPSICLWPIVQHPCQVRPRIRLLAGRVDIAVGAAPFSLCLIPVGSIVAVTPAASFWPLKVLFLGLHPACTCTGRVRLGIVLDPSYSSCPSPVQLAFVFVTVVTATTVE